MRTRGKQPVALILVATAAAYRWAGIKEELS